VVGHWDRLPRAVVIAPSLPEFGVFGVGVEICPCSEMTEGEFTLVCKPFN